MVPDFEREVRPSRFTVTPYIINIEAIPFNTCLEYAVVNVGVKPASFLVTKAAVTNPTGSSSVLINPFSI